MLHAFWKKNHIVWTGSTVWKLFLCRRMWYEFWGIWRFTDFVESLCFSRTFTLYLKIESYCKYWQSTKDFNLSFQRYTRTHTHSRDIGCWHSGMCSECTQFTFSMCSLPFTHANTHTHARTYVHTCRQLKQKAYNKSKSCHGISTLNRSLEII